jgi:hypothetical protein
MARQCGWAKVETLVGHENHHLQMLHLGMQLCKAGGLGPEPVLELALGVHLHFQQHDRLLPSIALVAARPEHTIEAEVHRLEFGDIKAIQRIA